MGFRQPILYREMENCLSFSLGALWKGICAEQPVWPWLKCVSQLNFSSFSRRERHGGRSGFRIPFGSGIERSEK